MSRNDLARGAGVIILVGLLISSCGSGPASESGSKSSTSSPRNAPASTSTTAKSPTYKILTEEQLTGALLSLQALPAGYSESPSPGATSKTFCDYVPPFTPAVQVRRDFEKSGGMSSEIWHFGSDGGTHP